MTGSSHSPDLPSSEQVDRFVASFLDAFKEGTLDRATASAAIGEAIFAAARGDREYLANYLATPPEDHAEMI